jgi:hypothetical protein
MTINALHQFLDLSLEMKARSRRDGSFLPVPRRNRAHRPPCYLNVGDLHEYQSSRGNEIYFNEFKTSKNRTLSPFFPVTRE